MYQANKYYNLCELSYQITLVFHTHDFYTFFSSTVTRSYQIACMYMAS